MLGRKTIIIGVGGGSASGKTSICHELAARLTQSGRRVSVVTTDWFYKDLPMVYECANCGLICTNRPPVGRDDCVCGEEMEWKPKLANADTWDWDDPDHFDVDDIVRVLKQVKQNPGKTIIAPAHDYTRYKRIENGNKVYAGDVVIIEGIFVLHEKRIRDLCDLTIFVKCDGDTALARRVLRDVTDRKYNLELVLYRYEKFAKPAFDKYIEPSKKNADIIVPNNGKEGINSLRIFEIVTHWAEAKLGKTHDA